MIYAYNTTLRRMPIHKKEHWKNAIIFLGNNSLSLLLLKVKQIEHAITFYVLCELVGKKSLLLYLNSYILFVTPDGDQGCLIKTECNYYSVMQHLRNN